MTARFDQHKNFITPEECAELNAWVDEGLKKNWLGNGYDRSKTAWACTTRKNTRQVTGNFKYTDIVRTVSARIRAFYGVSDCGLIVGHGQDGVVVSCTFPSGTNNVHYDYPSAEGLATLRCNILTRAADSGGVLHLEGKPRPLEVGELHCYLASEHRHSVSEVEGNTSRVMWMFGAHVPKEDWDSGLIKSGC